MATTYPVSSNKLLQVAFIIAQFATFSLFFISANVGAQIASSTSLVSAINPSLAVEQVGLTSTVASGTVITTFTVGLGRAPSSVLFFRYDLINAKFRTTVVNADFKNQTLPAAFSNIVIAQGGAVGQSYVVFQIAVGAAGLLATHILQFDAPLDAVLPSTAIGFSVHSTALSVAGEMPANTEVLVRPDNVIASTFAPPFPITGNVTFISNNVVIPGCNAAPVTNGIAQCNASFLLADLYRVSARYNGNANYLISTGNLAGGQRVLLDVGPPTLPTAKVNSPYSTTINGIGANGAAVFTIKPENLPEGLSLASGGTLSGTPLSAGPYELTIQAVDPVGFIGSRKLSLTVEKGDQTISFDLPATSFFGNTIMLNGTATSRIPVSYSVSTPNVCAITGTTLRLLSAGNCVVTPTQSGDFNWFAAPSFPRAVNVLSPNGVQPLRLRSDAGLSQTASLVANQLQFTNLADPGVGFRTLGLVDIDGNKTLDLAFLNTTQGDIGEVSVWNDVNPATSRLLRSVRTLWRVDAVGDLDGDGFGDLVWRFTGQTPNFDDTGVSYVWFINANSVVSRKRGGAPLSWQLLGAVDLNADNAADMLYISPTNEVRALMATAQRSCANLNAGTIPQGFTALKAASFTRFDRGDVLIRNSTTGEVRLIALDATGLMLPASTSSPTDPNAACTPSNLLVRSTTTPLLNTDPTWRFYGVADFNGDGLTDVVWARPDGTLTIWLSNGNNQAATVIDNAGVAPNGFTAILQ